MCRKNWLPAFVVSTVLLLLANTSAICQELTTQGPTNQGLIDERSIESPSQISSDSRYLLIAHDDCEKRQRDESKTRLFDELSFLAAVDGSKQPQDFGVNAVTGGQLSCNCGIPLFSKFGIGLQAGTGITSATNAVKVFEALGETTSRTQSFTSVGAFQRLDNGVAWGFTHDFLDERYFDRFNLSQWRFRASYPMSSENEFGFTGMLRGKQDTGFFNNSTAVRLRTMNQGHLYWRHFWMTGAQTTAWMGVADKHGQNNAVLGTSPGKDHPLLFGSDIFMPLTASLAIYGETNMIMPMDTGTVDAFLGIQWFPSGKAFRARRGRFSPLLTLASPVSFAVDLLQ